MRAGDRERDRQVLDHAPGTAVAALPALQLRDFGLLQQHMHVRAPAADLRERVPVSLYVFDVLEIDGRSLLREPYDTRREQLLALGLDGLPGVAVPPAFTDVTGAQLLDVARAHRLEGIVAKRRTSRYEPGRRSAAWVKTALLTTRLEPLHRDGSPFDDEVPREYARGVRWVAPSMVGEVQYRTLTSDGRLRHAAWRGLRPDRNPDEVVLDAE